MGSGTGDPPSAGVLQRGKSEVGVVPDDPARVPLLLEAAVGPLGGVIRPGQQAMAEAITEALARREHLLVEAGTGTGKSLGYLVPALAHAVATGRPVVVSTATLTLQAQIVDRDLPRLADVLAPILGRRPTWQLVKGRRNYVCRNKLLGGFPVEDDVLFRLGDADDAGSADPAGGPSLAQTGAGDGDPGEPGAPDRDPGDPEARATSVGGVRMLATYGPVSGLARDVERARTWAEATRSGDRDELVPGVSDRVWRQVSVSAEECLGAQRCPLVDECHSELARRRAHQVDVVVTNHALVAIDSFEGLGLLPDHEVLIVDEAHELADRVTSVISDELTPGMVEAAGRRARRAGAGAGDQLSEAGQGLADVLAELPDGRLAQGLPEDLRLVVTRLRDVARDLVSALKPEGQGPDADRQVARAAVTEVYDVAERLSAEEAGTPSSHDVVWVSRSRRAEGAVRTALEVAPLSVAGLLRERFFVDRTVVLTSATLTVGGGFDAMAGRLGLRGEKAPRWQGLDVGSPFDYARQGMLYIARHLPPPGRDGTGEQVLDELAQLIEAAGGRTLGLFSSRRAAQQAAAEIRARSGIPVLCQGEDSMPTLVREFGADPATCLFGTLSLWQGVDVPGTSCQLVVIDRIPFPRPDDPLSAARAQAANSAGGNGFLSVAATQAALLLAQGVGRLIRSSQDRGVVAVLDSRLATARYAGFLRASLPPFWTTTSPDVVRGALSRLAAAAG